ncbi:MAG: energy transducer TonB [Deltaproteobacteria bacterium]|nr:energy transducer TonB [Deltaproteobacteria bacterium]
MPTSRTITVCVALSLLGHLMIMAFASLLPWTARRAEEVMVVDLADLPRATDFLPPKAGILQGGRPKPSPPPRVETPPRQEARDLTPPRVLEGRVPDLPVNPALPPEERFPQVKPREAPEVQAKEPPAQTARAEAKPAATGKTAPATPVAPKGSGGGGKALKDLSPSLGKMVIAMGESGRRGQGSASGSVVGTGTKAGEKGGIVEEGGGGATLTALNAPEIQYISYFAGIKRKIELVWGYPGLATGQEGETVIDFVIGRSGKLESVALVHGSGHRILDDEALGAIRKAAPFDPIPKEYRIANLQIRAHFLYTVTHTRILR